jgi:hypothetical protein
VTATARGRTKAAVADWAFCRRLRVHECWARARTWAFSSARWAKLLPPPGAGGVNRGSRLRLGRVGAERRADAIWQAPVAAGWVGGREAVWTAGILRVTHLPSSGQ